MKLIKRKKPKRRQLMPKVSFAHFSVQDAPSELDAFVQKCPQGGIHQTRAWYAFQQTVPGRDEPRVFVAYKERQIQAVCWGMKMYTGIGNVHWWYSPRGPIGETKEAIKSLVQHIANELKHDKTLLFWRTDGPFTEEEQKEIGIHKYPQETKSYQPTDSLCIDLTHAEDEILAQMKRKGRYNIKQATKHGVEVKRFSGGNISKKALDSFYTLLQETTQRDGFSGHSKAFYQNMLEQLGENAHLFLAYAPDQKLPLAGAILTLSGPEAIYYYGASSSDASTRKYMAPYAVQWAMMRYAKAQGAERYDLTGISPEGSVNHVFDGITQFKTRFGGTRKTYAAGKEIPLRPVLYTIYRTAKWLMNLRKLLKSR